jgi:hypothetical protein
VDKNTSLLGIKKGVAKKATPLLLTIVNHYFLGLNSDETDNFFLPFALLLANTFLPLAEAILSRKPCLFLLFLFDG